ncbi:MAG: hypothetical protein CVU90_13220 [Firmicutes bacterium HGW-Firmicutes-15]|nr:MAG: hypothetical protein CVU90_13220 [Firmicutes bacterium HGW-Firmicutes-15]
MTSVYTYISSLNTSQSSKCRYCSKTGRISLECCRDYYNNKEYQAGLTHTGLILSTFFKEKNHAIEMFKKYNEEENTEECLEDKVKKRLTDQTVQEEIRKILKGKPVTILQQMEGQERDEILRRIKEIEGSSLRQIARITGLGLYIIHKA